MKDRLHIRIVKPIVMSAAGVILIERTALGGSGFHCHTPEQIKAWETQPARYKCLHGALMTKHVFPDFGRECWIEHNARLIYNRRLDEFRRHALRLFYKTISENAGFQNDWKSVWKEFCSRAKASADEAKAAASDSL